jgi:hypothetical protein
MHGLNKEQNEILRRGKSERKEITRRYEAGEIKFDPIELPIMCNCAQRPGPHELKEHAALKQEGYERGGRYKVRWPWALRWAGEDGFTR